MTSEKRQEIIAALQSGRKILAIKLYRDATGKGLADAKDFIEQLQVALNLEEVSSQQVSEPDESARDEIVRLLSDGHKIHAIKLYRERMQCDLRTAKEGVEAIAGEEGIESPSKGCSVVVFSATVLCGFLVWLAT